MSSPFKVTTGYHSCTIRTGRSKVAAIRSTTVDDLKPLSGISKSQAWEFVFSKSKIEESVESGLHVVVLVSSTKDSFRFRV